MDFVSFFFETYQFLLTSVALENYGVTGLFETVNLDHNAEPRHDDTIPNPLPIISRAHPCQQVIAAVVCKVRLQTPRLGNYVSHALFW